MVKWWQIYNLYKLTYRIFQHLWTIYLIILSPWFDRDISIKLKKLLNLPDFPTPLSPTTRIFMSFPLWWPPFGSLESSITGFGSLSRWYGKGIRHPQSGANLYNIFFFSFSKNHFSIHSNKTISLKFVSHRISLSLYKADIFNKKTSKAPEHFLFKLDKWQQFILRKEIWWIIR